MEVRKHRQKHQAIRTGTSRLRVVDAKFIIIIIIIIILIAGAACLLKTHFHTRLSADASCTSTCSAGPLPCVAADCSTNMHDLRVLITFILLF
jgi:hypothetical protein